jgi:beta-glucosidase
MSFALISPENVAKVMGTTPAAAVTTTITLVIIMDCIMTFMGSTSNDAAFNAWITDITSSSNRAKTESILALLPVIAMVAVTAAFGALSGKFGYPACFIGLGYIVGTHAPFEKVDFSDIEAVGIRAGSLTRNVLLCHGEAVQILRKRAKLPPVIGMAINGDLQEPASDTPEDIEAARAATFSGLSFFNTNWWCDPAILGTAPDALKPFLSAEDLEKICQPLDFFGFNCYQNSNYAGSGGGQVPPVGYAHTDMGWPITPNVLYWAAKFFWERYHLPFLITENGMANLDFVMLDGKVHDPQRIDFMHRYIAGLQKAADEGVPVMGYTAWSVMDNYEWAEGYLRRFGLIYVDYKTQERIPKDSFWWYKDVIRKNGVDM